MGLRPTSRVRLPMWVVACLGIPGKLKPVRCQVSVQGSNIGQLRPVCAFLAFSSLASDKWAG
jgi:hypothetical protein